MQKNMWETIFEETLSAIMLLC